MPVYVNGVPARCLVDTGATANIMNGSLYRNVLAAEHGVTTTPLVARDENRRLFSSLATSGVVMTPCLAAQTFLERLPFVILAVAPVSTKHRAGTPLTETGIILQGPITE